ncbi:unnamed protein product [Rhizoctonia solani]|uniref:RING-type E3 ubiquitin transferase n=1 Tax=Rhizoctonia solani TaxID=456999 RepID=A0A8H3DPX8_9AGAM|nr:unnamed protein product [Rhizoctonia solani]
MGQETSRPVSRGANAPSSRRISRYLRRDEAAGDDDRPQPQEGLEAPTPGPHSCPAAGDHHLDDDSHLPQGHRLVRAHHPQPEQAPSTTETSQAAASNRASKEDRMGSTAVAQSPKTASDSAAATGKTSSTPGEEEQASSTLAQVQASPTSATPASSTCSAQSLEQLGECILDSAPTSTASTSTSSTPITTTTQSLEQPGERVLDPTSTTSPASTTPASPVAPVTTVESLQSALASSHTTTPDSVAPTLSSSALPSVSPQQPLSPSSSTIPRPLPLGTTMIVQGLVQTIEVSRIPARTTPATTNEPDSAVEERPLLDKGKGKEAGETNDKEISEPLASGSSSRDLSTPISNTSDSNPSDTLPNDALSDTTPSPLSNTTDTLATPNDTPNTTPATTPPRTPSRSSSPSSTDVLGLLLSIAAQATAEALVPWSVPPRSRATPREGIASGLAAAFSALAGAGAGVTTNSNSGAGMTVSEPAPQPQPATQPLAPVQPTRSEPRSSRRFSGLSPRRFSRLSLSPGRISSLSSRRLSSFIPGQRASSTPVPRRTPSPARRASTPIPKPPRRGVLDRIERWVPRRLRRETEAGPSRRPIVDEPIRNSPSPLDESVDFGRAPPTSSLPVSALPESSVSPLPSPLAVSPGDPMIEVPTPGSVSPVSAHTSSRLPTPAPTLPAPSLPPTPTTDAEDLIRFSQMLGFTPGIVHPPGSFERFLADMQDELRVALGEYQERVRSRVGVQGNAVGEESAVGVDGSVATEGDATSAEEGTTALLDHTRHHVPSTDPLPLNWWRMFRFPALPDARPLSGSGSSVSSTLVDEAATSESAATFLAGGATTPLAEGATTSTAGIAAADAEPIHPAIIIGLRSITRDPTEETSPVEPESGERVRASESEDRVWPVEGGERVRSSESGERVRSSEGGDRSRSLGSRERVRSRHRRLRLGEDEERRRDGTRNYIIWIIGGYYPSNHPLLAHPNLFLGQVHPDELWMLNEFLGQVKPPTATQEDIAKAGLRIVKGVEVKELAASGSVTENCTERCLICLEDYADEEDLRIMNCKHMFHKDCVDRWMETGRNNCPACRTKGVEIIPTSPSESSPTPVS